MFIHFFEDLRAAGIPVTLREYLNFLGTLDAGLAACDIDRFYQLARCSLVKNEVFYDRFDRVFGHRFKDLAATSSALRKEIPKEWLEDLAQLYFSKEELERLGKGAKLEDILEEFRQRLREQDAAHRGGSKWIGTGGRSKFGHGGINAAGVRVGGKGGLGRAVKVWEERRFRNLDASVELGTRNFKVALRRLRQFAREGLAEELDLPETIRATARSAGMLDLKFRPARKNRVKVLMLLDIGGSMDPHVQLVERLFAAAGSELKNFEHYYFHNCPYESLWRDVERRYDESVPTPDVYNKFGKDYKLVFVGDAAMSPYEISQPNGSVEHYNAEAGSHWIRSLLDHFPHAVWLNPRREELWDYTTSTQMVYELMAGRMFELSLSGLEAALKELMHRGAGR